jgi:hypothetical protein
LLGIIVVAVGLRLVAALYMGNEITSLPGVADQRSYHNLALRVVGGYGFSFGTQWWPITAADAPTAHWSYLYTLYLTVVYAIFGPNPLAARLIQAVAVGILQPVLLFQIGRIVFNRQVGLVAAFLGAVYVYFFYYSAALMTEAFYITAILGFLYLLIRFAEPDIEHPWRWVLAMGVVLGVIVLLRQLFLFVTPFLFLWVWWARYRNGGSIPVVQTVVVGLIAIMMVLPFTVYNYARFDRFVLLNTNAGYAFFWGNHPVHGTDFVPILTDVGVSYEALIPDELWSLDEAALESALMERGLQFVFDDPGRYVQLSFSRIVPYFEFWPSAETSLIGNISRVMSFGVMLPFMIAGVIIALRQRSRRDLLQHPTALLFAFALIYAAIHILTWTLIRYRLPIDAVMLVFAALAIVSLAQKLAGNRHQSVTTTAS